MNGRNIGARIVSILLVVAMLFSLLPAGVAQAQERISQREDAEILPIASPEEIAYKIVNIISAEILIDSKGIKILNEKNIIRQLNLLDLKSLEELAESRGIVYKGGLTGEKIFKMFAAGITFLDEEIKKGNLLVLSNGTIVDANDDNFYLQGGMTFDQTFIWGRRRFKSTANARTWVYDMRAAAHLNAGAALVLAVFGAVFALPNGLTALYTYHLADRVEYWNGRSSRGIKADIWWIPWFSISTQ